MDEGLTRRRAPAGAEPLPRFIVAPEDVRGDVIVVRGAEGHHARNVLRLDKGDGFVAVDGRGAEYDAVVQMRTTDGIRGRVTRATRRNREPVAQLTLGIPLLPTPKIALIVGQATALGVREFVIYESARAVKRTVTPLELKHLNAVAAAVVKQSLRSVVPPVVGPKPLTEVIRAANRFDGAFLCRLDATADPLPRLLGRRPSTANKLIVAVGPEGGFEPEEEEAAGAAGWRTLDLGPRRLRTETAAPIACALILYAAGDLGPAGGPAR